MTANPNAATGTVELDVAIPEIVAALRTTYASGRTRPARWRIEQLRGIERLLDAREGEVAQALAEDLGRSAVESWMVDINNPKVEAADARKRVRKWMRRRPQPLPLNQLPTLGWVQYEPLGVVLVIAPWNGPVVLEGDGRTTQALLAQDFDHGFLHRRHRNRQEGDGRGRRAPDPGAAQTRRQEPGNRHEGRGPRRHRPPHRLHEATQFRPDLNRAGLRAGRAPLATSWSSGSPDPSPSSARRSRRACG